MLNDFCKLYVDCDLPKSELVEAVRVDTAGERESRASVLTSTWVMDIEDNDDFDEERKSISPDGFLYFRYHFDVEPVPGVSKATYVESLSSLLVSMSRRGFSVVPACDFEDLLPKP